VNGKTLKTGDYQLDVKQNSVVIVKNNKQQVEVPARVEDVHHRFESTRILYNENKGKFSIEEIELGGTTTRLMFGAEVQRRSGE
jgi:hypothetical protein